MTRALPAAVLTLALISPAAAQDGPLRRAGRALDNAGKSIRNRVETEVARGQITAQERELLAHVSQRLTFDKQLVNSVLQLAVRADGAVILRGSIPDEVARTRAVDLAQSTLGVTAVVDELAVARDAKVIEVVPARVIVPAVVESKVIVAPSPVIVAPGTEAVVPAETKVIVKP